MSMTMSRTRIGTWPQFAVTTVLFALVGAPLVLIIWGAFRSGSPLEPSTTYTLDAIRGTYGDLLNGGPFRQATIESFKLALSVLAICIPTGAAISLLLCRSNLPGRALFKILILLPLFFSPLLDIIGWQFLLADRSGLINRLWQQVTGSTEVLFSIYSYSGVILVMSLHVLPYVLLFMMGPIQSLDSAMEEAAEISGATKWETIRFVTLPLLMPSLGACALFIFIVGLEMFTVPFLLGSRLHLDTIAIWIYEYTNGYKPNLALAAAGGSLLLLICAITLYGYRRLVAASGSKYVTVGGRGFKAREIQLGRWRWVFGLMTGAVIFCISVIPMCAVLLRSFLTVRTTNISISDINMRQYERLFSDAQLTGALTNSLMIAITGAFLCTALGGLIGLWNARQKSYVTTGADYLLMTAFGLPGILLGLGFLWTFVSTPVYLTIWILLIAVVTRYSGLAVQGTKAAVLQTDKHLEEAAEIAGASRFFANVSITIPLLKGTLSSIWLMLFLILFREISMTVLLYGPETKTMTILTWNFTTDGDFGMAAALSMFQFTIALCVVAVWKLAGGGSLGRLATK